MNKVNLRFHKIRVNWLWVATEIIDHQKWFFFWNSRYKIIELIFLFFSLYIIVCCSLLYFVFQNGRVWPLKRLKKLPYLLMAGNSSRIHEKIQIHFDTNFASLTDSVKHFDWRTIRLIDWLADLLTEWLSIWLCEWMTWWPDRLTAVPIG